MGLTSRYRYEPNRDIPLEILARALRSRGGQGGPVARLATARAGQPRGVKRHGAWRSREKVTAREW